MQITRFALALISFSLVCSAISCSKGKRCKNAACTASFASVTVEVRRVSGSLSPLATLDEAYTIREKTGQRIAYDQNMGTGLYVVLTDSYRKQIANTTESFRFVGMKNGRKVVDEPLLPQVYNLWQ